MSAIGFCQFVVDPLYASKTLVILKERNPTSYIFEIQRPSTRVRARVLLSDLEIKDSLAKEPLPAGVPFESLRIRGGGALPKSCGSWFP